MIIEGLCKFKVVFSLGVKTSLRVKPSMWKCVSPTGSFSSQIKFMLCKLIRTRIRFQKKAKGNLETAIAIGRP